MKGFTFFWRGKDVFVVTERKTKTLDLAQKTLRELGIKECTKGYLSQVKASMQKANLEINGDYVTIKRPGSTVCDPEGKTIIIRII